ncbi:hypothetical protein ACFYTQ_36000 [Nocardia sp. NPDC004068]|uniref:hypothetical protein n=1 Tax=Nocardia sp. NPDC004068 TaxID=3364303 RepID=UPI0036821EB3
MLSRRNMFRFSGAAAVAAVAVAVFPEFANAEPAQELVYRETAKPYGKGTYAYRTGTDHKPKKKL